MIRIKDDRDYEIKPALLIVGLITITIYFYLISKVETSHRITILINSTALILGLLFQGIRIINKWSTLTIYLIYSAVYSLVMLFLKGSANLKELENHLIFLPFYLLFTYFFLFISRNKKKITTPLTKGLTLLQSVALIYWIFDTEQCNNPDSLKIFVLLLVMVFILVSIYHAFSQKETSENSRLGLSVWSSIIMLIFAIDNIAHLVPQAYILSNTNETNYAIIVIQFFILGISSIYIIGNLQMIIGYIPDKSNSYKPKYYQDIDNLTNEHIQRYSPQKIKIKDSLICILYSSILFAINYRYNLFPRQMTIWFVFISFPFLLKHIFNNERKSDLTD